MENNKPYRFSKYNIISERPEGTFIWNTYSNALIKLNQEGREWIEGFDGMKSDDQFFEILEKNGCIVDTRLNETAKIIYEEKKVMLDSMPKSMHFTIAPGLGCNYKCPYCFEKGHELGDSMDKATQDLTVKFITEKMQQDPNLENLEIRWFGGEPLLYMEAIRYMSRGLMSWCKDHDINYSAGIVTNGRFLTHERAEILKNLHVEYVQLSMDGMGIYYEKQKGAVRGDFDAVVKNICESAALLNITVRINVMDDLSEALKLTDYLLKKCCLEGKIRVYIAHVRDYGVDCREEQKSHGHFLELEGQYLDLFGRDKKYNPDSLYYAVPKRRCTTCKTICETNYCIGPKGECYRCEHHFGEKDKVVCMVSGKRFFNETETYYINHKHPDKCTNCKLFPVCLGGCMNDNKNGEVSLDCDTFIKRQFDNLVRNYVRQMQEQKKGQP